eukprot:6474217-Amphidinium_carterae.1
MGFVQTSFRVGGFATLEEFLCDTCGSGRGMIGDRTWTDKKACDPLQSRVQCHSSKDGATF